MSNNFNEKNIGALDGIIDIEPPETPILYTLEISTPSIILAGLITIGLLLIVSAVMWKYYFSTKARSRHQLTTLQKQLTMKAINHHSAACQISKILRNNLGLNPTLEKIELPEELEPHKKRWHLFTKRLSTACYSSANQPEVTSLLFEDAHFWIKSWPCHKNV